MTALFQCPDCAREYRADKLASCPGCSAPTPQNFGNPTWELLGESSAIADPNVELLKAVDRTTYAIRSLAIFLFTTLCTSLLGYGLIGAGAAAALRYDPSSSSFVIWGWIIIALGFIVGLIVGINELGKSRP